MSEMTYEAALDLMANVATKRARWGRSYRAGDVGVAQLLDACVRIAQGSPEEGDIIADLRKSLKTANKQKGAAEARAKKFQNRIKELEAEFEALIPKDLGGNTPDDVIVSLETATEPDGAVLPEDDS